MRVVASLDLESTFLQCGSIGTGVATCDELPRDGTGINDLILHTTFRRVP